MAENEQNQDANSKKRKKTLSRRLFALMVFLTKNESVGTSVSFIFHFFLLCGLALVLTNTTEFRSTSINGGFSIFDDALGKTDGSRDSTEVVNINTVLDESKPDDGTTTEPDEQKTDPQLVTEVTTSVETDPE
ncbi:MAG: hypothetical protein ACRC2T_02580, partial [Thermoguttaceae bacterium]